MPLKCTLLPSKWQPSNIKGKSNKLYKRASQGSHFQLPIRPFPRSERICSGAACDKQVFAPFPSGCGVWRGGGVDQQLFISTLGFTFGGGHVTIVLLVLHSGPRYSATTKQQLQMDKPAPATTGRQPVKGLLLVNGRCVSIGCLSVNEGSLPLSLCLRGTGCCSTRCVSPVCNVLRQFSTLSPNANKRSTHLNREQIRETNCLLVARHTTPLINLEWGGEMLLCCLCLQFKLIWDPYEWEFKGSVLNTSISSLNKLGLLEQKRSWLLAALIQID